MSLGRLVVIEGPDVGGAFELPMRGGGIGRGEGNCVQLTDLAVSRHHCTIEWSGGGFVLLDEGSRNKTLVNGKPITRHPLQDGDEVAIGKTRLTFVPAEGGLALVRQGMPSRVTMEVGSGELLRAAGAATRDQRAARHLAALAELGQSLRERTDRIALAEACCQAACASLGAERAFFLLRDGSGALAPRASQPRGPDAGHIELPHNAVGKVLGMGAAIALDGLTGDRVGMLAPLTAPGGSPLGALYVDRPAQTQTPPWDQVDLLGLGCLAHLVSAAMASLETRDALIRENQALVEQAGGGELIGHSPPAETLLAFIAKVAPSDATVLLTGESGSGKEMVARALHRASRRSEQPFIAVNCAAMTETLIESELFGHERGAFTGATERKIGRFESADKGTLFLDEVGELPLALQTKFLRVLEEQTFERVGGTRSIQVDVRVVAATNRDLGRMVADGTFREDLFYRLSVIHTVVPPLRDRPGDIAMLAEHFLSRFRRQVARRVQGFAPDAIAAMVAHRWPGNVRELRNAVERALVLGEGEWITRADLPPPMSAGPAASPGAGPAVIASAASAEAGGPARSLRELERDGIARALAQTGGNKAQAAAILEIDRSTLYKKIKDYGIET